MNYEEKKAMVERLKTTWTTFGGLSKEEQEFLKNHWSATLIRHKGTWQNTWFGAGTLDDGASIRLAPDFTMPIEPPAGYRIVSIEDRKRCKYPVDCDIRYTVCGGRGWMPPLCGGWRSDETDGFSRRYAVPSDYTFAEDRPKFVECPVFDDCGWSCSVEHLRKRDESVLYSLHELPSIVGFTGDILFRYSDGTEQWRCTLTDRSRDGAPATPIAARFYVKGETK
jgi:hypothetical protein